jgi:hypothetical protein
MFIFFSVFVLSYAGTGDKTDPRLRTATAVSKLRSLIFIMNMSRLDGFIKHKQRKEHIGIIIRIFKFA